MTTRGRLQALALIAALSVLSTTSTRSADVSATANVVASQSERDGLQTDLLNERYSGYLGLTLTRLLRFDFGVRYSELTSTPKGGTAFERTESQPSFDLRYARPLVSLNAGYRQRRLRATSDNQDIDIETLDLAIGLRPPKGPSYELRYTDTENALVSVFGRDSSTRTAEFRALHRGPRWRALYSYSTTDILNPDTGLRIDQDRHIVQGDGQRSWREDRLTLTGNLQWIRSDQDQRTPAGAFVERPIRPREGLFAVDTSPALDPLPPAPGLIDGDEDAPAAPLADIGAASTFRNFGVDLGITRPVTTIEIQVDSPSSPSLIWEVWTSPDNLNWTPVPNVGVGWDAQLLRYVLTLPRLEARYIKTVNTTANAFPEVFVTELRVFERTQDLLASSRGSDTVRLDGELLWRPNERVTSRFRLAYYTDDATIPGLATRDIDQFFYESTITVNVSETLRAEARYSFADYEQSTAGGLAQTNRRVSSGLYWLPLDTVDVRLEASTDRETERGTLLRRTDNVRVHSVLQLLPAVRLVGEVGYTDTEDSLNGFVLETLRFREFLNLNVTRNWSVGLELSRFDFESEGSVSLEERTLASLLTTWTPDPRVVFNGSVGYRTDDFGRDLNQRYTLSFVPGSRLGLSATWFDFSDQDGFGNQGASASATYRLRPNARFFASWSRTRNRNTFERVEVDAVSAGATVTL